MRDALHVGGRDFSRGGVERVIERPVAGGDVLVEAAGDGEGAVAFVGGGGGDFAEGVGDFVVGWRGGNRIGFFAALRMTGAGMGGLV